MKEFKIIEIDDSKFGSFVITNKTGEVYNRNGANFIVAAESLSNGMNGYMVYGMNGIALCFRQEKSAVESAIDYMSNNMHSYFKDYVASQKIGDGYNKLKSEVESFNNAQLLNSQ